MKRYIKIEERKLDSYKAWYFPLTDKFIQFSTNMIHSEVSLDKWGWDEYTALQKGAVRINLWMNELNINTSKLPNTRIFKTIQYALIKHTKTTKIVNTVWDLEDSGNTWFEFKNQSFFLSADSMEDGIVKGIK